jgi:predicted nuclease of restriction endonuclease-like (RecB) superfamily
MADLIPNSPSYQDLLSRLKSQIRTAQVSAAVAVNQELVFLYWGIGKEILGRQAEDGWGSRVIERLAKDLRSEFPDMRGLSSRNLGYMKAFAEAWPEEAILQEALAKLTWYHNLTLLERLKSRGERLWYAEQAIQNGWSRNVLVLQIESGLYHLKLRCFCVIDSKMGTVKPEYAGKTNFYLAAVDERGN